MNNRSCKACRRPKFSGNKKVYPLQCTSHYRSSSRRRIASPFPITRRSGRPRRGRSTKARDPAANVLPQETGTYDLFCRARPDFDGPHDIAAQSPSNRADSSTRHDERHKAAISQCRQAKRFTMPGLRRKMELFRNGPQMVHSFGEAVG